MPLTDTAGPSRQLSGSCPLAPFLLIIKGEKQYTWLSPSITRVFRTPFCSGAF